MRTAVSSMSDHSDGTGITSFFRRATTMRVPKVLTINAKTSTEFHITANGFEGFLKMPKERGIRYGWTKQYVGDRGRWRSIDGPIGPGRQAAWS